MDHALLLNATYEPLKVVDWRKAITLWCQGKVEVISVYDREVHSVSLTLKLPSVVRLRRYVAIRRHVNLVPFSRANIYARDDHTCQYCGRTLPVDTLTLDHVVPVRYGGRKEHRPLVCPLQSAQGWAHTGRGGHDADSSAASAGSAGAGADRRRSARGARELAGLSLLDLERDGP